MQNKLGTSYRTALMLANLPLTGIMTRRDETVSDKLKTL